MAETSGHQSCHISSSLGEKGGSCAELHPKHPSPESPGSPFEMIANSSRFEFKDNEDKCINYGLKASDRSAKPDESLLFGYTHQGVSIPKEDSFINKDVMLHVRTHTGSEDFEPEHLPIELRKSAGHQTESDPPVVSEGVELLCKASVEEVYLRQNLGSLQTCEETSELNSAKIEDHSYDSKSDLRWPDADEDLDSSGESDDTVIDAGWRFRGSETDRRENTEDGWVELNDTQQGNEPEREDIAKLDNSDNHSEPLWSAQFSKTQTLLLTDSVTDKLNRAASKMPDSPHSEGFVDLVETYVTDSHTGAVHYLPSESLEDQVQENLTIEALRALAAGVQDGNSESQESSPEILCPQFGDFQGLKSADRPGQAGSHQDSTIDILTFKVHDLLFWRDVKKSGMVFGATMVLLLSLAAFSIISVISYFILSLLTVTISFRIYKSVMQAVQKSEEGHPFKCLLEKDITLSSDSFQKILNASLVHVNHAVKYIMRLFLVEDLVDSLKLALLMWLMTYVGAVFNGITLLILGVLVAFSAPVVYEKYKVQIDHYVSLVHSQVKSITEKIQAKLPAALKKKTE
ncbi:reticulon-3 [Mixophyes fleayi]|uniref:reticulon-3 n=1 Tax=Mixophyes fleayi TaxID=3061075 RepID=UPI003F4E30DD